MTKRLLKNLLFQSKLYCAIGILLIAFQFGYAQTSKKIQPVIGISPLWVAGEYGLYWGGSISAGVEMMQNHAIAVSADLAPVGLLDMTDVDTKGKKQHWGGTLSYLFKIAIINNLIRIEPGATMGISSIPYIYGTFVNSYSDSTPTIPETRPARKMIGGFGPELRISLGRNSVRFFMAGRTLFEKNNTALLTNLGVSFVW